MLINKHASERCVMSCSGSAGCLGEKSTAYGAGKNSDFRLRILFIGWDNGWRVWRNGFVECFQNDFQLRDGSQLFRKLAEKKEWNCHWKTETPWKLTLQRLRHEIPPHIRNVFKVSM